MTELVAIRESEWTKDDGTTVTTYWTTLEGYGMDVPCYDAKILTLTIGEALPEGWSVKQSKAGKDYLAPPKAHGGGGKRDYVPRFGDTEPGFAALQERMDRRTALMQAVTLHAQLGNGWNGVEDSADLMYAWLRETSGSATPPPLGVTQSGRDTLPVSPSVAESDASPSAVIGSAGGAESGSGVAADAREQGEGSTATVTPDPGQLPHEAVWIQSPTVRNMRICAVQKCALHPARRKDETTVPA